MEEFFKDVAEELKDWSSKSFSYLVFPNVLNWYYLSNLLFNFDYGYMVMIVSITVFSDM